MNQFIKVLTEADRLERNGEPFALATVVRVGGSAYRRPGARLLVAADGTALGAISGGCLEKEIALRAAEVLRTGKPEVVAFDVSDTTSVTGFGAGCGSTVTVLIQRIDPAETGHTLALLRALRDARTPGALCTVTDASGERQGRVGRSTLVLSPDEILGTLGGDDLPVAAVRAAQRALEERRSRIVRFDDPAGRAELLVEWIRPRIRLFLFGDSYDVEPVTATASKLGWECIVVGSRSVPELRERFPEAASHRFLMHPNDLRDPDMDAWSAVVIMTHQFLRDRALLRPVLASAAPYVGVLGPASRTQRLIEEGVAGLDTAQRTTRLFSPVGLDIGTETPEEIALALVAEIQAVFSGRSGRKLRSLKGPLHEAVPVIDSEK